MAQVPCWRLTKLRGLQRPCQEKQRWLAPHFWVEFLLTSSRDLAAKCTPFKGLMTNFTCSSACQPLQRLGILQGVHHLQASCRAAPHNAG